MKGPNDRPYTLPPISRAEAELLAALPYDRPGLVLKEDFARCAKLVAAGFLEADPQNERGSPTRIYRATEAGGLVVERLRWLGWLPPERGASTPRERALRSLGEGPRHVERVGNGLSVQEAGRRLGITDSAVRQAIYSKKLRAKRIGGAWSIPDAAVEEYTVSSRGPRKGWRDAGAEPEAKH